MVRSFSLVILVVWALLIAASATALAQGAPGSIKGRVSDSQQLPVSKAEVDLTDSQGRSVQKTVTDDTGYYAFSAVAPGTYTLVFSSSGLRTTQTEHVTVANQQTLVVDVVLKLQPMTQSITVTATASEHLAETVPTGTRLGLDPLETPASVNTITSEIIDTRGYAQIEDAVDSMPGVISGGAPGDPSQFSSRGFQGDQIKLLRDGLYLGPSDMITRPQNTFNVESVEMLKGPSSVLYGQGSVGGTVNVITKPPVFTPVSFNGYISYGSFNTYELGLGAGGRINDHLAFRGDFSYYSSKGFVEEANPNSLDGTGALVWKIKDNLDIKFAVDAMGDHLESYYGTPIVSAAFGTDPLKGIIKDASGDTIDARMRYKNYNVSDQVARSTSYLATVTLRWQLSPNLSITNELYYFHAYRKWLNAETYTFIGPNSGATDAAGNLIPADQIARDRFHVYHHQNLPGDQLNAVWTHPLFGLSNKLSGGIDTSYIDFRRPAGAPNSLFADFVDPLNPIRGTYGNYAGDFPSAVGTTKIGDIAWFAEDALDLSRHLKVVTGIRYENFQLDRKNFDPTGIFQPDSSFTRLYHPFNYRAGFVYSFTSYLTAYGQYSTAQDPGGDNVFLVNAAQNFKLSSARQGEVGLKSIFPKRLGDATLALYDIERKNVLTQTTLNTVSNAGSERSKGVEFSLTVNPVTHFSVNFDTAYTYARYGTFIDPATLIDASGNWPLNVPAHSYNVWANLTGVGHLPLELGSGYRFVGDRFQNEANTRKILGYGTLEIFGTYHLNERLAFTARGKNLTNKAYAQWADISYPPEVILGAPRSFEVAFTSRF